MAARKRPIRKPFPSTKGNEDLESLLVFGYECKQFRDDEKALYIEQGRHLIPWMGDSGLLIDRYDGRGHLFDLHAYDAAKINTEGQLSEEEQRIEALCDEERYLELHTDLSEKAIYEEEELKRLNQAFNEVYDEGGYAAVGFNYNWGNQPEEEEEETEEADDEDDEPYEVPPDLQLPPEIIAPTSLKAAKIVEKTAKFVSKQGVQMEILIKTKQSDNPQFSFLEHGDPLNAFYKHMTAMLKSGRYTPKEDKPDLQRQNSQPEGQEYLHPKLMKLMKQEPEPEINSKDFLESVKAKLPSGQLTNSLYAKLVDNMKQVGNGRNSPVTASTTVRPAVPKRALIEPTPSAATAFPTDPTPQAPTPQEAPGPLLTTPYGPPPLHQPATSSGYHAGSEINLPPPPGMEPVTLPSAVVPPAQQPPPPGTVPPEPMGPLDSLNGAYGGDASFEEEDIPPDVVIPPPDIEPIIDKMAAYVAKNGPDFEAVVKNKIDERFHFLNSWHVHNKYYEYRKNIYLKEQAASNVKVTITQTSQNAAGDTVVTKTTTTLANVNQPSKGVSFSIKPKENEGTALTGRKIMLYDSSDEEDEEGSKEKREAESDSSEPRSDTMSTSDKPRAEKTTVDPEEAERRQAEERCKDRISNAAREKVAQASREKQLQLERKRRAAMFINMLKGSGPAAGGATGGSSSQGSAGPPPTPWDDNSRDGTGSETAMSQNSPRNTPPQSRSPSPPSRSSTSYPPRSPPRPKSPTTLLLERQRQRELERRKPRSPRKSRSRSPVWPGRRRRYRSRTPPPALPSAYSVVRRSRSPPKKRSRSRSPVIKHKKKRSRSRERNIRPHSRKSKSPPRIKEKKSRKRSKSKSPSRKHKSSHSSEPRPRKTKSRSKSPSSKKPKKSKHRSHSPSESKSHHRGGSKSREGSVGRLLPIPEVKTPQKTYTTTEASIMPRVSSYHALGGDAPRDDDVIVISPTKDDVAPPLSAPVTRPPLPATPTASIATPPYEGAGPPQAKPDAPVSRDLLSKVRAMLKASRAQVLKEDGPIMD